MTNVRFGIISVALIALLAAASIDGYSFKLINDNLEEIKGHIMLHDSEACVIQSETLANEELAIQLVRACVKTHQERTNAKISELR